MLSQGAERGPERVDPVSGNVPGRTSAFTVSVERGGPGSQRTLLFITEGLELAEGTVCPLGRGSCRVRGCASENAAGRSRDDDVDR